MNLFKKLKKKLGILAVFGLLFQTVTPIYQNAAFAIDGEVDQEETVELTDHEEKTNLSNTEENPEERIESEEEKDPDLLEEETKKEEEKENPDSIENKKSEEEAKEAVEEKNIEDKEDKKTEIDSRELKVPLVENEPKRDYKKYYRRF